MSGGGLSPASARMVCDLVAEDGMRKALHNAAPGLTLDQAERIVMVCRSAPAGRQAFQRGLAEMAAAKIGPKIGRQK